MWSCCVCKGKVMITLHQNLLLDKFWNCYFIMHLFINIPTIRVIVKFFLSQLLSRKDKAVFERLEYLMSKEDNYKRLRDYIRSQSMNSCIPYLGKARIRSFTRLARGKFLHCFVSHDRTRVTWCRHASVAPDRAFQPLRNWGKHNRYILS